MKINSSLLILKKTCLNQSRSQSPRSSVGGMHGIHCIPLLSDPVHLASAQYLYFLTMEPLQRVDNDIVRKNYVSSSLKTSCPGIKTLNHIKSESVKVFVVNIWSHAWMHAGCNLHCVIFPCQKFSIV